MKLNAGEFVDKSLEIEKLESEIPEVKIEVRIEVKIERLNYRIGELLQIRASNLAVILEEIQI